MIGLCYESPITIFDHEVYNIELKAGGKEIDVTE